VKFDIRDFHEVCNETLNFVKIGKSYRSLYLKTNTFLLLTAARSISYTYSTTALRERFIAFHSNTTRFYIVVRIMYVKNNRNILLWLFHDKKRLRERAVILRYMYTAHLVIIMTLHKPARFRMHVRKIMFCKPLLYNTSSLRIKQDGRVCDVKNKPK
jgi:hypothetical protein